MQVSPPDLKKFPPEEQLRTCQRLADLARDVLEEAPIGRRTDLPGERMILALSGRAVGTFNAVLPLAEAGYGDQVGMLARALFEANVDAYWIAEQPSEAQRLATLHLRQARLLVAENWNLHERRDGDPALPLFAEDIRDRAMLAKLFGPNGQRHWTRLSLFDRIAAIDESVPQARDGELRARYENDNRLANFLLHGSPMALNDRIEESASGRATIHIGASAQHLANGLQHAYWSYERLLLLVCKRRAPHKASTVEDLYELGWPTLQTITVPALKKVGRNGPCPCGSGRKVKDCHGDL